jgi:hypothetical protein
MTRKYALIFVVIIIFILILLEGFFGTHGYFVNRELSSTLAAKRFLRDEMALEVESLQKRLDAVWDEDELRDNALRLGYSVAGDTVFYFSQTRQPEPIVSSAPKSSDADSPRPKFKGISFWVLFIVSGALALVLSIMVAKVFTKFIKGQERTRDHTEKPD